ncbi:MULTISPECIES: helix-turn-helix domain-containing protein [Mumia]|uniref:helix-turn-helix domain-containing protein n=1 Tax=Mumia TaxID=1546255 RepID=UPI001420BF49|nr:helix-turn-helix domain-containing protein [Mumia sp. ZJ430]
MAKLSVPQAAARLGVSPARIRQRVDDGSLVAEKVGGRWLVDLDASWPRPAQLGRPVSPESVWWSLACAEEAMVHGDEALRESLLARMRRAELALAESVSVAGAMRLSRSTRSRAVRRLADAVQERDHSALLVWLSNRAARVAYVAAATGVPALRADSRLVLSGVSHADSSIEDPRVVEAYVGADDVDGVVVDHWLEKPMVDERPNVVLHVAPVHPPRVGAMLLAADLAEHGGPREEQRARELLDQAIDALAPGVAGASGPKARDGVVP